MRRIIYFCEDWPEIGGGVQVAYSNACMLNDMGFDACVMHVQTGFRHSWFEHCAPIVYADRTDFTKQGDSIFVVPEVIGPNLHKFLPSLEKKPPIDISRNQIVIFSQSFTHTFRNWGFDRSPKDLPYLSSRTLGVITVSEFNADYLRYVFPKADIYLKRNSIDPALYFPESKNKLITILLRKNQDEALNVLNALQLRDAFGNFELAIVQQTSKKALAELMRKSAIFLSFGYPESFGLPAAEAIACGCTVIGYAGFGGVEFFEGPSVYQVPDGNVFAFIRKAEEVIKDCDRNFDEFVSRGRSASMKMLSRYSPEHEKQDLRAAWTRILTKAESNPRT